jgi:hypothetical protein
MIILLEFILGLFNAHLQPLALRAAEPPTQTTGLRPWIKRIKTATTAKTSKM